eukprot:81385-Pyramimonas_sp.AAC.1
MRPLEHGSVMLMGPEAKPLHPVGRPVGNAGTAMQASTGLQPLSGLKTPPPSALVRSPPMAK